MVFSTGMSRIALKGAAVLWALACSPLPISFEEVPLEVAHRLLRDPRVTLIEAVAESADAQRALPGGFRWRMGKGLASPPRGLPSGRTLVIAANARIAHRSAAALVRAGNQPVSVFILTNAEERSSLYALALQIEETIRGEDS